jgi:hypothetical protein
MVIALSIPVIVSFLLLSAHFFRGSYFILACVSLLFPFLLLSPQRWAARVIQLALACGVFEWGRTAVSIMQIRMAAGEPYVRMLMILSGVMAFNLASVFVFNFPAMKTRYKLNTRGGKKQLS